MSCGECGNSRRSGDGMVYCRLYGIYIRSDYSGCKYKREGDLSEQVRKPEGYDTGRHV